MTIDLRRTVDVEVGPSMATLTRMPDCSAGKDGCALARFAHAARPGQTRVELLEAYKNLGVSRVMTIIGDAVDSDEVPDSFAADCETAGVELSG